MNSLIGDSRVRDLKVGRALHLINDLWCAPGATYAKLDDQIRNSTILHHGEDPYDGRHHIYLAAGICNLTTKLRDRSIGYEELIFDIPNMHRTIATTIDQIISLKKITINENADPIFCSIYPLNIEEWNSNRLSQGKTKFLSHAENYKCMQKELNKAVAIVNDHIFKSNRESHFSTPQLDKQLLHSRNKQNKTFKFNLLSDGCHPNRKLKEKLAKSLAVAINKNRQK